MGQKANPSDVRNGITTSSPSKWYANKKNFAQLLGEDMRLRKYLQTKLKEAGVSRIEIERNGGNVMVDIYAARPGIIIGRSGAAIEDLKTDLMRKFGKPFAVSIHEIKAPDLDAAILGDAVARQLEKRVAFRRAAKSIVKRAMDAGAKGVKVEMSGRLAGADIARREFFTEGKIPLQTFRADISYATERAETTYGTIGVKVWVFKGEVFKDRFQAKMEEAV